MTCHPANSRNRLFVLAIVTVGLGSASRAADATSYCPDGTMLVVSFNLKPFLEARLIRDSAAAKPLVEEMQKAFAAIGVDVANDLDRVALAVGEQLRSASYLLLLQGRFDADKVVARIKEKAAERKNEIQVIDEGGAIIVECRLPSPGPNARVEFPNHFYLTVLDGGNIAVAVDRAALTEALAKRAGRRKSEVKPRLTELLGQTNSSEALSVVFVPPPGLLAGGPMSGLATGTGGVTVTDGITAEIRLTAKNADAAKPIADTARDALAKLRDILPGLAALQLGLKQDGRDAVKEMVETFKVATREDTVIITGNISRDLIEKASRK